MKSVSVKVVNLLFFSLGLWLYFIGFEAIVMKFEAR